MGLCLSRRILDLLPAGGNFYSLSLKESGANQEEEGLHPCKAELCRSLDS